jgi:CRP/FNR family transcriptional regulator, cyclic AMP receptor protein
MPEKVWFLRRLNLFDGMTEAEIQEVSHDLKMRSCAPRHSLLFDSGDRVYLLKEGKVRLYHLTPDGQDITTAVLSPGQLFGLGAFLGADGTATHAEALEESWICEAGAQDFLAMLARHPLLMARVVMVMAKQIFRLEQTIEKMASQQVAQRLADILVDELAAGRESDGGILLPAHSQEELARLIGTTRESVSRTLSTWRSAGVITMKGRRIVVLSPDRLRREADSEGTYSNAHK